MFCGEPRAAWREAAVCSARRHIVWLDRPVDRILAVMPAMYDDLWTAAKGAYKTETAVADGGEVVIFAPHVAEVSYVHGRTIDEVGYHCRDYFLSQWDRFRGYPGGVLAHSTHVKGLGEYDAASGVETPRIRVTLATGIPRERCDRINLGYVDPAAVRPQNWPDAPGGDHFVVPRAGEMLFRVGTPPSSGGADLQVGAHVPPA
jgi:nickel-dependent lactate racemase